MYVPHIFHTVMFNSFVRKLYRTCIVFIYYVCLFYINYFANIVLISINYDIFAGFIIS
ncbi:hypothetical protein BFO_0381 [Tannerella forsythia 92A2]|uniref:Uncharacterized protein n=1 Tax=Tannerella forsythia (strain ATCC 43037 / JCM 10827 / CCUG 21028 A / KCTC 5666 / FDC 338) TaxID=203275 RepID=G8UKD7_TANFA|nr:hypothetical protein BFO_0381 [Tannerella forsythia 92A2]